MSRKIVFYILTSLSLFLILGAEASINVVNVEIRCDQEKQCEKYRSNVEWIKGVHPSLKYLEEKIKIMALDDTMSEFSYEIREKEQNYDVAILIGAKKVIRSIHLVAPSIIDKAVLLKVLPFREGSFYEEKSQESTKRAILKYLSSSGYLVEALEIVPTLDGHFIDYIIKLSIRSVIKLRKIEYYTNSQFEDHYVRNIFDLYLNKHWNSLLFDQALEEALLRMKSDGFYSASLKIIDVVQKDQHVEVKLKASLGVRVHFYIEGAKSIEANLIKEKIIEDYAAKGGALNKKSMFAIIDKLYLELGIVNSRSIINIYDGEDQRGFKNYKIALKIVEGVRLKVSEISFSGNVIYNPKQLLQFYMKRATPLAERGFYDPAYVENLSVYLKQHYLEQGYVQADVSAPKIIFDFPNQLVRLEYKIKEFEQTVVSEVEIKGLNQELTRKILEKMHHQKGGALNPLKIEEDIVRSLALVKDEGYFFAQYESEDLSSFIHYDRDYRFAKVRLSFMPGKKTFFDSLIITGNSKTRTEVITREVTFKKGDLLTLSKIDELITRLNGLGIFSSVKITPRRLATNENQEEYVNLQVQLQEREFKHLELAPGFRSDIGVKLSSSFSFQNIGGMNREVGLRAQANQRLDYSSLDSYRQEHYRQLTEFTLSSHMNEPYVFRLPVEFDLGSDFSRKRFYNFDADILRLSTAFSKKFNRYISGSLLYQLEAIKQFNATEEKDSGFFRIGTMTPSLQLDLRDNPVLTRKGSYFSLSYERASPLFYSLDREDLTIDYHKIISRNRFYIPLGPITLASTISAGVEENLAKEVVPSSGLSRGYIPSIKAFRLNGEDLVRGFADDEINKIQGGEDINEVRLEGRAYFSNLKIEPRYQIDDNLMLALFYDAGGVYVDKFTPLKMKSSLGVSLKLLTGVGSLNFDYGLKTNYIVGERDQKESVGRFHLLVGFF